MLVLFCSISEDGKKDDRIAENDGQVRKERAIFPDAVIPTGSSNTRSVPIFFALEIERVQFSSQ